MNTVIKINKNELSIDKNTIKFNYDIRDIKVVDNQVIILLSIPFGVEISNIYAISLDCKIIWKVENRKPNRRNLPFENIFLNNRILTATDFYGKRYFINITNGLIEKTDIVK